MASSLFSTSPACLLCRSPAQAAISSSGSNFFSTAQFRQASCDPVPLSRSSLPSSVECSSRPRKKCTAHHNKTRPKKHSVSEKKRKPTVYPKPPVAPPVWSLGWGDEDEEEDVAAATPASALEPAVVGA